jgi:hypothetical protein
MSITLLCGSLMTVAYVVGILTGYWLAKVGD